MKQTRSSSSTSKVRSAIILITPDTSEENSSESIHILVFCVMTLCHNIVDDLPTCQASRCHFLLNRNMNLYIHKHLRSQFK